MFAVKIFAEVGNGAFKYVSGKGEVAVSGFDDLTDGVEFVVVYVHDSGIGGDVQAVFGSDDDVGGLGGYTAVYIKEKGKQSVFHT